MILIQHNRYQVSTIKYILVISRNSNSWNFNCQSIGDIILMLNMGTLQTKKITITYSYIEVMISTDLNNDITELLIAYLPILVLVQLDHSLVHNLLELCLSQIGPHHHLEHIEQLLVGDEAIPVHVIDVEQELELLVLVHILGGEHGQAPDKLSEVQLSTVVSIKH